MLRLFGRTRQPARRPAPTFCPEVERLDARIVPVRNLQWKPQLPSTDFALASNWWDTGTNARAAVPAPTSTDNIVISGSISDNDCTNASGTVLSLTINGNYSHTLTLSGDLTAGSAATSNALTAGTASGTIDTKGKTLTLQGPADTWNICQIDDTSAGHTGVIDFTGWNATMVATSRQLCYAALTVDGKLTFTKNGGLDFGDNGSVNVQNSGQIYVKSGDLVKYDVTFTKGSGNINSWLVQNSGVVEFDEAQKTVTVPLTISVHNSAWVGVYSTTHLTATGANGLRFYDSSLLYEKAGAPGATTVTTISATNGVTMNDSSKYTLLNFDNSDTEADLVGALTFNNSSKLVMGDGDSWASTTQPVFAVSGNVAFNATSTFQTTILGDAGGMSGVKLSVNGSLTWDPGNTVKMVINFRGTTFWTSLGTQVIATTGGINNAIGSYTDNVSGHSTPSQGANNFFIDT